MTRTLLALVGEENPQALPSAAWFKTRKGRGYLTYDFASHGTPHKLNDEKYWRLRSDFAEKYGARFVNPGGAPPEGAAAVREECLANLEAVIDVLHRDPALIDFLAERLVELGESVPREIPSFRLGRKGNPFKDRRLFDYRASSADLAESTNIAGFARGRDGFKGWGWFGRSGSPEGALLNQEITEFANSGIMVGMASVNLSEDPEREFDGFWGATSTYGSFSYLVYGPLRLFSQLAQDCQLKVGKAIYIASHSGPETAENSRTHFGVFSPGVTQLFPEGRIINLHPWEHNEVPVLLGAALATDVPLIALHLTRPALVIPDRAALGMPSHFEAARGAYVIHDFISSLPKGGVVIVQGTSAVAGMVSILDSTVVTTQDALSTDWDNRWRTGGTVDEVLAEAHLSPGWLLNGIRRFVADREKRLARLEKQIAEARQG